MLKHLTATLFISTALSLTVAAAGAEEEKITFTSNDGQETTAYQGRLAVPENRANAHSRTIPIVYVRFPATGERSGPPIVYLAGGPGGSGIRTAKYRRFAMFMALRAYGDVIALDQRGTGASDELPECRSSQLPPATTAISDEQFIAHQQRALRECLRFWQAQNIDVAGYNTRENARDLDALRRHLGTDKIVLWGTSYGSHLALAALKDKTLEPHIERVILSSAEGLNQTIKMPARTDAYFARLQQAVNSQAAARAAYPDIKALMRRVHAKLDSEPVMLHLAMPDGSRADYLWQRRDMQQLAAALVADPSGAARLLSLYLALDHGITAPFEQFLGQYLEPGQPIRLRLMSTAMDIASGMTAARKTAIARQAQTALLKDYLNFTYHYDGIAPELDLGDAFRAAPDSAVPVLLFSGTLDGRTYLESQHEALAALSNVTFITVENAGHNLFMSSPAVQDTINRFMEGNMAGIHKNPDNSDSITIDLPDFAPPATGE